jgi:NADP-dependent 3-hydroxy acid dehydrogenase YdfG
MNGIEGKVVVVTGASSGIGEATALLLAERGAKVVLGARGSDRLKALADRIEASGGEVAYIHTDVKRRDDLSNLVGLAVERYGKLDVLINNNAGVAPNSFLDELFSLPALLQDWEEPPPSCSCQGDGRCWPPCEIQKGMRSLKTSRALR